jgi:hypothetical protein
MLSQLLEKLENELPEKSDKTIAKVLQVFSNKWKTHNSM